MTTHPLDGSVHDPRTRDPECIECGAPTDGSDLCERCHLQEQVAKADIERKRMKEETDA